MPTAATTAAPTVTSGSLPQLPVAGVASYDVGSGAVSAGRRLRRTTQSVAATASVTSSSRTAQVVPRRSTTQTW